MSMFARASNGITINNSNFHAQRFSSPKGRFERLQEFVAHGAFHDSGERFDPPKCHPNTRIAIIKRITDWFTGVDEDTRETLVAWPYGAAGAGKSAIAQTIAEILDGLHIVLASFFFSRNDSQRGTAKFLLPTLAYQLAAKLPHLFRDSISRAFENDPLIITRSLDAQFKSLVREPLFELFQSGYSKNNHIVIVIDGLDEYNDPLAQAGIVEVAFRLIQSSRGIPLKILIASRPEIYISTAFESKPSSSLERVALDDDYQSFKDIRCFLSEKLSQVKAQHHLRAYIPGNWPPLDVLDILVGRSSDQFIYASTVAKYVASPRHRPTHRIDTVLGIRPLKAGDDNPFSELDALYRHILMGAEEVDMALKVIGLLVLHHFEIYTGISVAFAEAFLSLDPGDVQLLMQNLSSIVSLSNISLGSVHKDVYVHILHASLKDYLLDQSRPKDLFLDPLKMHTHYAELSLAQINAGLFLST